MNPWQDHTHFMKHMLDRLSYIDSKHAGGAGRSGAIEELIKEVELQALISYKTLGQDVGPTSRLLYFADFLRNSAAATHRGIDKLSLDLRDARPAGAS